MSSNTRFSMAVHIMTVLAYLKQKVTSELLADSVNTNAVVIRRLLGALMHAGLIHADRGQKGGYTLARTPAEITLLDIYQAVMTHEDLVSMHDNPENRGCAVSCHVRGALSVYLDRAQSKYEQELAGVRLADIEQAM